MKTTSRKTKQLSVYGEGMNAFDSGLPCSPTHTNPTDRELYAKGYNFAARKRNREIAQKLPPPPAAHAPGPWRVESCLGKAFILDCDGNVKEIARCDSQANAAYIVQACNSYPALVEALEDAVAWIAASERTLARKNGCTGPAVDLTANRCPAIIKARSALAQAKKAGGV